MKNYDNEKPTVLIVDDTPANIQLLIQALKTDYELRVFNSGLEALEFLEDTTVDLILLDIIMPNMDGYQVCSLIKKSERLSDIPVIFISSLDEIEGKTKGFKIGGDDYITKPFEIVEVQARVRLHLERKKAREKMRAQNKQLSELSRKLSKYLSPQIYDSIFSGRKDAKLETQRKMLTIFFSDIVDFTEITERMEPEILTLLLNDYLNTMSETAIEYGGTIDKFIGDAILIFFGDPESKGIRDDALACVQMAIAMKERLKLQQFKWNKQGVTVPLSVRIGITTGFCTVGNFGSENRLDYTIIGNQVNLANRLQCECEPNQILLSNETFTQVKDEIICEKKDEITLKGIPYPIQTYQVVVPKEDAEHYIDNLDFSKLSKADRWKIIFALKSNIINQTKNGEEI